jgi:hypothetical protein
MNIFKKIYIKHLIEKAFKKEFVDTGYVQSFKVIFDKEKQDYYISYIPLKTKNLDDMEEVEIINNIKEQDDNE